MKTIAGHHLRWLVVVMGALLLTACAGFSEPKKDLFFRLPELAATAPRESQPAGPIVYVPPFLASGVHGERALLYAHADGTSLEQYTYSYWVDSPRVLFQQALVEHLRAKSDRRVVVVPSADASHTVTGRIRKFERHDDGKHGVAEIALEFEVVSGDSVAADFVRSYARALVLNDDDVGRCAAALGGAAQEILAQFADDLRAHWGE